MDNAINRLVSAGMKREDSYEVVHWFIHHGNDRDMERFIMEYESGQGKRLANG